MNWGAIGALTGVIAMAFAVRTWVTSAQSSTEENSRKINEHLATEHITAIPKGAIMIFDLPGGCPKEEWEPLNEAAGKFILGASDKYKYRESGGKESYILDAANIPPLSVTLSTKSNALLVNASDFYSGSGTAPLVDDRGKRHGYANNITVATNNTGAAKNYDVMPPYLPLHLCKKK